jgi:hypothetical protein
LVNGIEKDVSWVKKKKACSASQQTLREAAAQEQYEDKRRTVDLDLAVGLWKLRFSGYSLQASQSGLPQNPHSLEQALGIYS